MTTGWYIAAEKARLEKGLPKGVRLRWVAPAKAYEIVFSAEDGEKVLRKVPRSTIQGWRRPQKIMAYVARWELYEAGLPAEFRMTTGETKLVKPS